MARYRDGAAVAWYDTRDGNAEIYLRLIDSRGWPSGPEHRLTTDDEDSYEISVAALDDALALAWYGKRGDGALRAHIGVWDPEAGWHWLHAVSENAQSRNPVIRAQGDRLLCAWIEGDGSAVDGESVKFGFWNADGSRIGEPRFAGAAGAQTWNLNAALEPEGARGYVVFDAPDRSGVYELFVAEVDEDAVRFAQLSDSDGFASKYPDIAISSETTRRLAAVTWLDEKDGNQETYLAVTPLVDLRTRFTDEYARRISDSDGPSIGSYLVWNGDHIGVAWSDQSIRGFDIHFQEFYSDGKPRREIVKVTDTDTDSLIPAIVAWNERFTIAWNEMQTDSEVAHGSSGSEIFVDRMRMSTQP